MSDKYTDFIKRVEEGHYSFAGRFSVGIIPFLEAFDGNVTRFLDAILDNSLPTTELRIEAILVVRHDLLSARMVARALEKRRD